MAALAAFGEAADILVAIRLVVTMVELAKVALCKAEHSARCVLPKSVRLRLLVSRFCAISQTDLPRYLGMIVLALVPVRRPNKLWKVP